MSEYPETTNGASPQSPHLTDELLAAWAADELAGDARGAVQRHLDTCAYCQSALAETQRIRTLARASANSAGAPMASASVVEHVLARLADASNAPAASSREQRREGATAPRTRAARNRRRSAWRRVGALAAVLLLVASTAIVFSQISSHNGPPFIPGPPGVGNLPGNWADVLPQGSRVLDVAVVSPTDIWAVGDVYLGAAYVSLQMHFDGKYWQRSPDQFPFVTLTSISMVSANDGWACGTTGDLKPALLHYSGGHWHDATASLDTRPFKIPQASLSEVHMASATTGWALGQAIGVNQPSVVFQYRKVGSAYKWEPIESFGDTTLTGMSVVSSHEIWLVGYTGQATWKTLIVRITATDTAGPSGITIYHWDTHSWDVGDGTLTGVSMLSSTDGWASGGDTYGAGILFHWDGKQWSPKRFVPDGQETGTIAQIVMTGANTGWAYAAYGQENYLYSTTHDQWFGYQVPEDRVIIAGAAVTPTIFLVITIRVNEEHNLDPVPVIYDMKNGSLLPEPSPTP